MCTLHTHCHDLRIQVCMKLCIPWNHNELRKRFIRSGQKERSKTFNWIREFMLGCVATLFFYFQLVFCEAQKCRWIESASENWSKRNKKESNERCKKDWNNGQKPVKCERWTIEGFGRFIEMTAQNANWSRQHTVPIVIFTKSTFRSASVTEGKREEKRRICMGNWWKGYLKSHVSLPECSYEKPAYWTTIYECDLDS